MYIDVMHIDAMHMELKTRSSSEAEPERPRSLQERPRCVELSASSLLRCHYFDCHQRYVYLTLVLHSR